MSPHLTLVVFGFHSLVVAFLVLATIYYFRPRWWASLFGVFLGLLVGYINLLGTEPVFIAFLLIVFSFFLGSARERPPWWTFLLVSAWVPVSILVPPALGQGGSWKNALTSSLLLGLATAAFAAGGFFLGRWLAMATRNNSEPPTSQPFA